MIHPEYLQTIFLTDDPEVADWKRPFAIVTAWNPDGVVQSMAENEAADLALRDYLGRQASVQAVAELIGASPDLEHQEVSLAIWGLTEEEAVEVGKRFRQEAIFWVEKEVEVVSCTDEGRASLGVFLPQMKKGS